MFLIKLHLGSRSFYVPRLVPWLSLSISHIFPVSVAHLIKLMIEPVEVYVWPTASHLALFMQKINNTFTSLGPWMPKRIPSTLQLCFISYVASTCTVYLHVAREWSKYKFCNYLSHAFIVLPVLSHILWMIYNQFLVAVVVKYPQGVKSLISHLICHSVPLKLKWEMQVSLISDRDIAETVSYSG